MGRSPSRIVWLAIWLALGPTAATAKDEPLDVTKYQPATGGKLRLEMDVSGGKCRLLAYDFYESFFYNEDGVRVRHLFPTRLETRFSGTQKGTYRAVPVNYGNGWFSEREIRNVLNHRVAIALSPESIDVSSVGPKTAAKLDEAMLRQLHRREQMTQTAQVSPVSVWITEADHSKPFIEVFASVRYQDSRPGLTVDGQSGSYQIERTRRILRQDGAAAPVPGNEHRQPLSPRLKVRIGSGDAGSELFHTNLHAPEFCFQDPNLRFVQSATGHRIVAGGEIHTMSQCRLVPDTEGGFGDTRVTLNWRFTLGSPPDVGWFQPDDEDSAQWLPERGQVRKFAIYLTKPRKVDGVRLILQNVSSHPGAAVNAGETLLSQNEDWRGERSSVLAQFTEGDLNLTWTRQYPNAEPTTDDTQPDVYFHKDDNPGFDQTGDLWDGRNRSFELQALGMADHLPFQVRITDWAAEATLRAQALIEGMWEDLLPKGPGADDTRLALSFPADADRDGIADAFDLGEGSSDGDSLSLFEEYRGALVSGAHRRFSPDLRDVFLIDAGNLLELELRQALITRFARMHGIVLHFLDDGEHVDETIGAAAQSAIVIESIHANLLPRILSIDNPEAQRLAWRAVRPRPECRTIFVGRRISVEFLAGDLARILGLSNQYQTSQP